MYILEYERGVGLQRQTRQQVQKGSTSPDALILSLDPKPREPETTRGFGFGAAPEIWVVAKIRVPFWVPIIIRHSNQGAITLTTTHLCTLNLPKKARPQPANTLTQTLTNPRQALLTALRRPSAAQKPKYTSTP